MCLPHLQLDPKSRRICAAGNLCLVFGLLPTLFDEHGFGHRHPVFEGLRILLLVCAVILLFWFLRRRCACDPRS